MENSDFFVICLLAFLIVFLVLFVLAIAIRLLIIFFPERSSDDDPAVVAAINTHMSRVFPYSKTTVIEEQK